MRRVWQGDPVEIVIAGVEKIVPGRRPILRDVSLTIPCGAMVALVGPSGAGKSTLLDIIGGLRRPSRGQVFFDSLPLARHGATLRGAIGFVPQRDIVAPQLTVEGALHHAARLRLPVGTTPSARRERVDGVLRELDLIERRAVAIGSLSGGQRKRASIATELLADPPVLLLDEPTAGLDPALERAFFRSLQGRRGRQTIVIVTHATSVAAEYCDLLAFLAPGQSGGRLLFCGSPQEAPRYFGVPRFEDIYSLLHDDCVAQDFAARRASATVPPMAASPAGDGGATAPQRPGGFHQFMLLTRRQFDLTWSDPRNVLLLMLQSLATIGLLVPLFRAPILNTDGGDYGDARRFLFIVALAAIWFGAAAGAGEIVKERDIFIRERHAFLGLAPYLASKLLLLASYSGWHGLAFALGLLLLGAEPAVARIVAAIGLLTLGGSVGAGLGLLVSVTAHNPDQATNRMAVLLLPQIILSGMVIEVRGHPLSARISDLLPITLLFRALGAVIGAERLPLVGPGGVALVAPDEFHVDVPQAVASLLIIISVAIALAGYAQLRTELE